MNIVSIDPGVRGCGVAVFSGVTKQLLSAKYVKNFVESGDDYNASSAMATAVVRSLMFTLPMNIGIIECPMVYSGPKQKGSQSDIVAVAGVSHAVATALSMAHITCKRVFPYQWKGQVPKEIMLKRIESTLEPLELTNIEKTPKSLRHNVLDAVGIGLHYFGRL